ncbi:MAG: FAD-dependent thymidylate synthase, partial [Clostridium sp.]
MKVDFINKDYLRENFFTMWGKSACVCYDTNEKYAAGVGKSCMKSGHFSGSRGLYFTFKISDVPRSLVDQLIRHEQGVFKNVQSFRYVSKNAFAYYTPTLIVDCPKALEIYDRAMQDAARSYTEIQLALRDHYKERIDAGTLSSEIINQSARGVIPMNTNSELVIGFTIEALIHLMELRLCTRTEEHLRKLARIIRKEVLDVFPEFEDKFK